MAYYLGDSRTAYITVGNPRAEPILAILTVVLGSETVTSPVTIPPNGSTFEVILTPKEAGELSWTVDIIGDGIGGHASGTMTVLPQPTGRVAETAPAGNMWLWGLAAAGAMFFVLRKR